MKGVREFSLAMTLIGDDVDGVVSWEQGDVASLASKPVRLRFVMKDADLYSFRFHYH